ncbi:MAG: hypothetical protein IJF68_04415 [Opitutales bacterium]|nr:hypothetical protein [Opitutales bacterium]
MLTDLYSGHRPCESKVIVMTVPVAAFVRRTGRFSALYSICHVPVAV